MPELPDIVVYVESLGRRIVGQTLEQVRLKSPFVLRTAIPPLSDVVGNASSLFGVSANGSRWSWKTSSLSCSI